MMLVRKLMLMTVAVSVAAACERPADEPWDAEPADIPTPAVQEDVLLGTGQFQSTANAPELQITGMAELRSRGTAMTDGAELHVQLAGLSEGEHAWHIHRGTCDSPGEIAIPLSDAPGQDGIAGTLDAGSDGRVEETVSIDREWAQRLMANESYSVNVHLRSGDDPGPPIACANLAMSGAAGMQPGATTPGTTTPPVGTGY